MEENSSLTVNKLNRLAPKLQNFGNIYGVCVGLLHEISDTLRVYEIKPLISGKYGMPVRILATMKLRKNSLYSIRGYVETITLDNPNTPVLMVSKLTEIKRQFALSTNKSNDLSRILFASFVYISDLEIISISQRETEAIIVFRREGQDNKYLNVLEIACITTTYSRDKVPTLTVGQKASIFGTIHRDRKYDHEIRDGEVGIKIMQFNPDMKFVNKLSANIEVLHKNYTEPRTFESLSK